MSDDAKPPRMPSIGTLTLIVGLAVQTAGIVWWGAHIDQRMTNVEAQVTAAAANQSIIARLDERTSSLVTTVDRIDARLNAQQDAVLQARKR